MGRERRTDISPQALAGRHASYLFWISGALTIVNNYLPDSAYLNKAVLNGVGAGAMLCGVITWLVPWGRFHPRVTLLVAPAAFGLIVVGNAFGSVSAYSYAVYFVVAFAWVGIHHPPRTAFALAPLAVGAYIAPPLLGRVQETASISSVTVAVPVCLLVAETIARTTRRMQALQEQLREQSLRDALTGVGNRRKAQELLQQLREGQALVLVDVDHFKELNDRFGHPFGDVVLSALADHLARNVRAGDVVTRYGGEEFLIVLQECTQEDARAVAVRLHETWLATDPPATFSAGVAQRVPLEDHVRTVGRADEALYRAKHEGRNRVVMSDAPHDVAV